METDTKPEELPNLALEDLAFVELLAKAAGIPVGEQAADAKDKLCPEN